MWWALWYYCFYFACICDWRLFYLKCTCFYVVERCFHLGGFGFGLHARTDNFSRSSIAAQNVSGFLKYAVDALNTHPHPGIYLSFFYLTLLWNSSKYTTHVTYEEIYEIIVFLIAAYVAGVITKKMGMPALVGEIICGFMLGPPLAEFVPYAQALVLIGEIGLIGLILEAGIELDVTQLRQTGEEMSWMCFFHWIIHQVIFYVWIFIYLISYISYYFIDSIIFLTNFSTFIRNKGTCHWIHRFSPSINYRHSDCISCRSRYQRCLGNWSFIQPNVARSGSQRS